MFSCGVKCNTAWSQQESKFPKLFCFRLDTIGFSSVVKDIIKYSTLPFLRDTIFTYNKRDKTAPSDKVKDKYMRTEGEKDKTKIEGGRENRGERENKQGHLTLIYLSLYCVAQQSKRERTREQLH